MKKLLYVFMASVLFACSTTNQLSNFSKQKYTKKFHRKTINYDDNINHYANNNTIVNGVKKYDLLTIDEKTPAITTTNLYKPQLKPILDAKKRNLNYKRQKQHNQTVIKKINYEIRDKEPITFNDNRINLQHSESIDSTVWFILLIVLALFISPISVLLADGIHKNFWINLILYILGAALWGSHALSLGWLLLLIAIIHAILIILSKI